MSPAVTAPGDLKHVGGWVGSRDWLELVYASPPVTELTGSRPSTRMFFFSWDVSRSPPFACRSGLWLRRYAVIICLISEHHFTAICQAHRQVLYLCCRSFHGGGILTSLFVFSLYFYTTRLPTVKSLCFSVCPSVRPSVCLCVFMSPFNFAVFIIREQIIICLINNPVFPSVLIVSLFNNSDFIMLSSTTRY